MALYRSPEYHSTQGEYDFKSEEHFCEIILKSGHRPSRCCLKVFSIFISGGHFVQQSKTILAILVKWYLRGSFL